MAGKESSGKKQYRSRGEMSSTHVGAGIRDAMPPAPAPAGAPGPLALPWPGRVRMRTIDEKRDITLVLDEDGGKLTPQLPRIEQVETPYRAAQSWWAGQTPGELTIACLIDNPERRSISGDIRTLELMAQPQSAGQSGGGPMPLQISGWVPGTDRLWQLTGWSEGEAIWEVGGYRSRQHLVLTLSQWLELDRADTKGRVNQRTAVGAQKVRPPVTVKKGDTLEKIARDVLGDGSKWKAIAALNKHKNGKRRRSHTDLKAGEKLKMPQS